MTTWQPRFVTGHPAIDHEHQRFFVHLDALEKATTVEGNRAKVIELVDNLQDYALQHFEHDETYMAQLGCESHPENYEGHREFALRLEGWRFLLSTSAAPVSLATEIRRDALKWIESHIADNECKLRARRCFDLAVST